MMKNISSRIGVIALLAWVILAMPAELLFAQPDAGSAGQAADQISDDEAAAEASGDSTAGEEEGILLNFRGASLDTVLDYLSKTAGFIIIRTVEVEGRVDVWSHQPLSKDEAVNLLNTILNEKGYSAIRNDRTLIIVKREDAKMRNIPVKTGNKPEQIPETDEMVTQIIPVRYGDAVKMIEDIKSLLPTYATATANESSNAIVLTDTQANIHRMVEIIQALDTSISEISTIKVFMLQYADAAEAATLINEVFKPPTASSSSTDPRQIFRRFRDGGRGGDNDTSAATPSSTALQAQSHVLAVPDERTNAVIVSAPDELIPQIETLVKEIDTANELLTQVRVFPLKYANCEEMATLITSIFEEGSTAGLGTTQPGGGRGGGGRGEAFRRMAQAALNPASQRQAQEAKVVAVADARTNSVVVTAVATVMIQVEQIVRQLDSDPAKDKQVFVYPIENADVQTVSEILQGMVEGRSNSTSVNTRTNTGGATQTGGLSNRNTNPRQGTGTGF